MRSHRHLDPARDDRAELTGNGFVARFTLLGALLVGAGCADLGINDDRRTTIWNGILQPEPDYAGLSGQAAALSRVDGTLATIILQGAQPGTSIAWGLRIGTCDDPGTQIGPDTDYPELVVEGTGEVTENATLGPRLSLDRSYHVEARTVSDGSRVACGDLAGELAS